MSKIVLLVIFIITHLHIQFLFSSYSNAIVSIGPEPYKGKKSGYSCPKSAPSNMFLIRHSHFPVSFKVK
jgi:hypothetical protein